MDNLSLLQSVIIESEMNDTKNTANSYLSFILFKIESSEEEAIKPIVSSMYQMLDTKLLLEFEDSQFLIMVRDNLSIAALLLQRIEKILQKTFETLGKEIKYYYALTDLHKNDTLESVQDRLELFLDRARERKNFKLSEDDKPENFVANQKRLLDICRGFKNGNETIKLSNLYKGIVLRHNVPIKNVYSFAQGIDVELTASHAVVVDIDQEAYLEHPSFKKILKADLVTIHWSNEKNLIVRLNNFHMLEEAPIQRKTLRVEPKNEIPIGVIYGDKRLSGKLLNISIESCAIKLVDDIPEEVDKTLEYRLDVELPTSSFISEVLLEFANPKRKRLVFKFIYKKEVEEKILKYISTRELEIIRELKVKMESYLKYKNLNKDK
jgi:hypothetical protein